MVCRTNIALHEQSDYGTSHTYVPGYRREKENMKTNKTRKQKTTGNHLAITWLSSGLWSETIE